MPKIINVENLSKRYRIGKRKAKTTSLRDTLSGVLRSPLSLIQNDRRADEQDFWALKDVNFSVEQGEVVGIIGRNGAGKSTLLKILSRITAPTTGRIQLYGRVGSLLEVGTGFHSELSGRENIYLNGSILGMRRQEIDRKFDEMVAFAEIDKFLDTPVKHYSSGMYVRLAFAVAAHLEPEILIVDEVLAVGDSRFQKKCLGKMSDVSKEGRTILFVSHNVGAVNSLTRKCIYINDGRVVTIGNSRSVIEQYLIEMNGQKNGSAGTLDFNRRELSSNAPVRITNLWINDGADGSPLIQMGDPFTIHIQLEALTEIRDANVTVILKNSRDEKIAVLFSWDSGFFLSMQPGQQLLKAQVEGLFLAPGQYLADVGINQSTETLAYDVILDFPVFTISSDAHVTHWPDRPWGAVHCDRVSWQMVN